MRKLFALLGAMLFTVSGAEDTAVQGVTPQDLEGDGYLTVSDVTVILKMLANEI